MNHKKVLLWSLWVVASGALGLKKFLNTAFTVLQLRSEVPIF